MNGFAFFFALFLVAGLWQPDAVAAGRGSKPGPTPGSSLDSRSAFRGQKVGHSGFHETQRKLLSNRRRKLLSKGNLRKPCSAILSIEDPEQSSNKKLRKDTGISDCSDGDINTDLTAQVYPYVPEPNTYYRSDLDATSPFYIKPSTRYKWREKQWSRNEVGIPPEQGDSGSAVKPPELNVQGVPDDFFPNPIQIPVPKEVYGAEGGIPGN